MVLFNVDLQNGFINDYVIIKINHEEVFQRKDVKSNPLLGYAISFQKDVPEGSLDIEVRLPEKDLSKTISLKISGPLYLGISIKDSKISFITNERSFVYL